MKKERIDMYAVIERESKNTNHAGYPIGRGKAFFLSKHVNVKSDMKESDMRVLISGQVSNSISSDIKKMASIMARNITEGLIHGRR